MGRVSAGQGAGIAVAGMLLIGLALITGDAWAAHSPVLPPGLSESEMRQVETQALGPEHAAEHAQQRALLRQQGELGPAITPRVADDGPAPRVAGPPDQVGQWGAPFSIPIFGIHAVMLPTGKVMWWSYPFGSGEPRDNTAQAWLWNPATGTSNRVDPPQVPDPDNPGQTKAANIWCSGQSLLADGRVLVTGGNLKFADGTTDWQGLNKVYTFNPFNETWTEQPSMVHGRWYPSQVLLPDGRTVIMSGFDESGTPAQTKEIELFTPSPDMNGVGQMTTIATRGGSGPPEAELYPRLFGMPSGRTLVAGPDPADSWSFNPVGPAPGNAFSWQDHPDFSDSRLWGTSVLEPGPPSGSGRVTMIGGSRFDQPVTPRADAETFDDGNAALGWEPAPSLNIGRSHANTVLLPDGSKLEVGGGVGDGAVSRLYEFDDEQRQVEIFDPATNTWSLGPSQAEGRAYHSTAVLLPDARVVSAGDNYNGGATADSAEIYSPPYLFKGARPAISSAPQSVNWGDTFVIGSASQVSRAVLMAPAATTHGNDMNQRHVELQVSSTISGVGINVVSPPNANVAPPGYYMLFLLDQQGVPSVSRWVRLDPDAPDAPLVSATKVAGKQGCKKHKKGKRKQKGKAKKSKRKKKGKKKRCKRL